MSDNEETAGLDATAAVLQAMNRDDQMVDALVNVYAHADENTKRLAAPLISWIHASVQLQHAMRLRRVLDDRVGTHSLVRLLRDRGRHKEADDVKQLCAGTIQFANDFLAHTSQSPVSNSLNLTYLSQDRRQVSEIFASLYREETGKEPQPTVQIDRSWTEAFTRAWIEDLGQLWWNRGSVDVDGPD